MRCSSLGAIIYILLPVLITMFNVQEHRESPSVTGEPQLDPYCVFSRANTPTSTHGMVGLMFPSWLLLTGLTVTIASKRLGYLRVLLRLMCTLNINVIQFSPPSPIILVLLLLNMCRQLLSKVI